MGRLNEFIQRATTGPVEMLTHASQQVSGSREGGVVVQQTYRAQQTLSPQHATPQPPRAPPSDQVADPPLFTAEARRAMDDWPQRAPLLYGPQRVSPSANEGSDRASSTSIPRELVQDEVRRQVVEAMRAQNEQLERLKQENEALRALHVYPPGLPPPRLPIPVREDRDIRAVLQGDRALEQPAVPQGDRALEQAAVPQGDRALEQAAVPQGDRTLEQAAVPQGDRAFEQAAVPQGDRAFELRAVPQGDRAFELRAVPQGDRALEQAAVPQGDRALGSSTTLRGKQASEIPIGATAATAMGVRFEPYVTEHEEVGSRHPF